MGKPLALDLFCGGGGACLGMMQAGFEVVGVDIKPHKNYPGTFIQADSLKLPINLRDFDFIWASPPCQLFSPATNCNRKVLDKTQKIAKYPNLIPETRKLVANHRWTCIENVPNAPIRKDVILTGRSMGLDRVSTANGFLRHRFLCCIQHPILAPRKGLGAGLYVYASRPHYGIVSHISTPANGQDYRENYPFGRRMR